MYGDALCLGQEILSNNAASHVGIMGLNVNMSNCLQPSCLLLQDLAMDKRALATRFQYQVEELFSIEMR